MQTEALGNDLGTSRSAELSVQSPIAGELRTLNLVLIEENVECGYDGVRALAKLVGKIVFANDHRAIRELLADISPVVCDLVGE